MQTELPQIRDTWTPKPQRIRSHRTHIRKSLPLSHSVHHDRDPPIHPNQSPAHNSAEKEGELDKDDLRTTTITAMVHGELPEIRLQHLNPPLENFTFKTRQNENDINTISNNNYLPGTESSSGMTTRKWRLGTAPLTNVAVEEGDSISPSPVEGDTLPPRRTNDVMTISITAPDRENAVTIGAQNLPSAHETSSSPMENTSSHLQKPVYHQKCYQKIATWTLEVSKSVLVLGDSNLARIPPFNYSQVQVDSFPGAQIHHLVEVLKKTPPDLKVQKVVWSVGLNNALRLNHIDTIKKQYQQLFFTTKKTFPHADILFSKIPFSTEKTRPVQEILIQINEHLLNKYKTLENVDESLFHTEKDNVHWTSRTAEAVFTNWLSQLN